MIKTVSIISKNNIKHQKSNKAAKMNIFKKYNQSEKNMSNNLMHKQISKRLSIFSEAAKKK
jgi:hypothetical protein